VVLPGELSPGRNAIRPFPVLLSYASLEAALVLDGKRSICVFGEDNGPNTKSVFLALVGVTVPLIKITELFHIR
jgi:hypothetical protein